MGPSDRVSPFSFLCWKDDDASLMASTPDSMDYISLISIDGVSAEEVVDLARERDGEEWEHSVAEKFPLYIAALAAAKGTSCFVQTGKAKVEFADARTCEVEEKELPATSAAYAESVRIEKERKASRHIMKEKKENMKDHKTSSGENEDDDDFETCDDDEESNEDQKEKFEQEAVAMVGSQFETAIYMASHLGLTSREIHEVFSLNVSCTVPRSAAECNHSVQNAAVLTYLSSLQ